MTTGKTRLLGVLGYPIEHSLSPLLASYAIASLGLDAAYLAFPVTAGRARAALAALRELNFIGANVTMPLKEEVIELLDEVSPEALRLRSVNTIVNRNGALHGYSTDGEGLVLALRGLCGVEPSGLLVAVIGTGSASRAVAASLAAAGARVSIHGRNAARVRAAATVTGTEEGSGSRIAEAALVVNATSVGMAGGPDPEGIPVDLGLLHPGQHLYDLVYNPVETPLIKAARSKGLSVHDGRSMLAGQAARAFSLFFGREPPLDGMLAAISPVA